MRVLTIVGVALVGCVAALSAQHGHQFEIGGFGTYTRFDPMWGLENGFGGGGRLGFFLNDYFGLEVSGSQTTAKEIGGTGTTPVRPGDFSLVINSGGEHNILYVLGGYTRMSMGSGPVLPLGFHSIHGAIGDRIFFGSRVALRFEARVYYTPKQSPLVTSPIEYTGNAGLSLFLLGGGGGREPEAPPPIPKEKRDSILAAGGTLPPEGRPSRNKRFIAAGTNWARQWFWGGQAGIMVFNTQYDGFSAEPTFGGHWLITARKTALYVGYEQSFFLSDRHATVIEPNGTIEPGNVAFHGLRRILTGVLAFPLQRAMQPFGGAGFSIVEVLNPRTTCTGCTVSDATIVQNAAESFGTKAFFWLMGGLDIRQGRLALYGHYILTSSSRTFLINGVTHTFQGGLRYSLGNSREDVTEQH